MSEYVMDYDGWAEGMPIGAYLKVRDAMHERKRERIVRCRDCRHATPDTSGRKRYKGYLWCDKLTEGIGFSVAPSDFCAWGEMEEGEI